jgi:L-lactate permease
MFPHSVSIVTGIVGMLIDVVTLIAFTPVTIARNNSDNRS